MPDSLRALRYRDRARDLRGQAAQTPWRDIREQMLEMAREYDLLAESVERQRGPYGSGPSH
jgi:hypothetical protein